MTALVHRLLQQGSLADRQRRALAEACLSAASALITAGAATA
ncbi:hypothetical protein [Streptomyces sp. NPDC002467]